MKEKDEILKHFREIHLKFSKFYARVLTQTNLTLPQYALLNLLANEGMIPMTEASEKLYITKPAVTHLVDQLEKNSLLKRARHLKDRRVYLLEIQPKGKKAVSAIQDEVFKYLLTTFRQFDARSKKVIMKFNSLLAQTMDKFLIEADHND